MPALSLFPARRTPARAAPVALALALGLLAARAHPAEPAAPASAATTHYDALAGLLRAQHPTLLVNPCVLRQEVRDNYVVTGESQAWGTRVGTTVLTYLNDHGLPAGPLAMPLICAQGRADTASRAADSLKAAPGAVTLPISTVPNLDPQLQGAYQALYAAIGRAAEPDDLFPGELPPASRFRLSPDDRARLVAAVGGRYVWVLSLAAADVSKVKLFNQRFLSRVAPELAQGRAQAFSYYELGLVDLDNATVLWKRGAGRNGPMSAPGIYGQPWADQLLGPVAAAPAPEAGSDTRP